ncbi:hypothetical protein RN001_016206 [Aquatica leii]|uniref:Uncharacterized protein n=1 Tax=Aquatica leii TaxID=1421715 RepID=A0AAN7NX99_9COLE|nr:hypothetical protein RN001_016206 [Aquatica leii]
MSRSLPVVVTVGVFFLLISLVHCAQNSGCIDVSNQSYRSFKSLVDYQGNKIPFDPSQKNNMGNYVKFNDGVIDTLIKNSFVTMDSNHIYKLSLSNHQIHVIQDGAFLSLNCVTALDLKNNTIEIIPKNAFEGLHHLHNLDLSQNKLTEIPERVFTFNGLLKKLNLSNNHLKVLHSDSFYNLILLEELDISYNYLHKVVPDTFRYFDRLVNLRMDSNEFEYLDLEKWDNLTSLKVLRLSNNDLKSLDFLYHFSFGSNLTELYLNGNYLTNLNAVALRKHLPSIQIIDISKNPWLCADLISILSVLKDSRISYNGSETSTPNFSGVACNQSMEEYTKNKWTEPISVPTTTTSTTTTAPTVVEPDTKKQASATAILDSIQSLHTLLVCLFAVVLVFIVVQMSISCGWLRAITGRRNRSPVLVDTNVEDISLLRGRL